MSKLNEQLLEAHVQFELERLSSQLENDIENEISAFFEFANNTKLKDFISEEHISKNVQSALSIKPNLDKVVKKIVLAIYHNENLDQLSLGQLLTEQDLERFLQKASDFQDIRQGFTKGAMNSDMAQEVITDLLYSGITRYISQTNEITKKVPGAKSVMKLSKGILNRTAPKLEDRVEHQTKKTIAYALPDIISQSERFISNSINDEAIKDITFGVWNSIKDQPLSTIRSYIDVKDVEDITDLILEQYQSGFNASEAEDDSNNASQHLISLFETGLKAFYKEYGNKKLKVLLKDLDLQPKSVFEQLSGIAPTVIEALQDSGLLEARIRARLGDFYKSDAAITLTEK